MEFKNDIERWFPLTAFNVVQGMYEISTFGNIRFVNGRNLILTERDDEGYRTVWLHTIEGYKSFLVHRLVARQFIWGKKITDTQVNHKNFQRNYNHIENLEWVTPQYNNYHKDVYGNVKRAENRCDTKFTNKQVHTICKLLEQNKSYKEILESIGFDTSIDNNYDLIGNIKRGITYTSISKDYDFSNYEYNGSQFTNNQIHEICKMIQDSMNWRDIAQFLNVNIEDKKKSKNFYETIRRIKKRQIFINISNNYFW